MWKGCWLTTMPSTGTTEQKNDKTCILGLFLHTHNRIKYFFILLVFQMKYTTSAKIFITALLISFLYLTYALIKTIGE
jgi:hypothetical protein